jgi:MFS family permease
MFIVMRLLAGGSAASVQVVGGGTIADIWHVKERGRAMGFFYLGPLMGPLCAPILGGALQTRWDWRSTQWFLTIYAFVTLNLLAWCLPETLKKTRSIMEEIREQTQAETSGRPTLSRVSTTQSVKQHGKIWIKLMKRVFWEPFTVVKYLRFPAVAITVYYASITFGALYTLQVSIQVTFSKPPYNFSALQIGLSYLSNSIGYISASLLGGKWVDRIMAREARKANRYDEKGDLVYRPEDRMRENAWLAAFMYPAALIWYGWTAEKGIFYVVPVSYQWQTNKGTDKMAAGLKLFLWSGQYANIWNGHYHADR